MKAMSFAPSAATNFSRSHIHTQGRISAPHYFGGDMDGYYVIVAFLGALWLAYEGT